MNPEKPQRYVYATASTDIKTANVMEKEIR